MTLTLLDYTRYLQFIASRSIFNRDDAEDVVSDVWLTIIRRRKPLPDNPLHAKRLLRKCLKWRICKRWEAASRRGHMIHLGDSGELIVSRRREEIPITEYPTDLQPLVTHFQAGGDRAEWRQMHGYREANKQFEKLTKFIRNSV